MARGGRRPGAGRKKGTGKPTKATELRREVALQALESGRTPLDVMLEAMREAYSKGGALMAMAYAKEVAPYVHPKLASIDAKVDGVIGQYAAQPIPVEERDSDALASSAGTPTHSH